MRPIAIAIAIAIAAPIAPCAGPATNAAPAKVLFAPDAEAAVEIRGDGLVLWWAESPMPMPRARAAALAEFISGIGRPGAPARFDGGDWSAEAAPGGLRLFKRRGAGRLPDYEIPAEGAAAVARLLRRALADGPG